MWGQTMKNTKTKIDFVTQYLTNYRIRIQVKNKNGLFDDAKLFECFAQKVCNLWFHQPFSNLNDKKPNFPYFDLLSQDKQIYVQVSTVQNIKDKIESTLSKIIANPKTEFTSVTEVKFFLLTGPGADALPDLQVGRITFSKDEDLITLDDVLAKMEKDSDFLDALYKIAYEDEKSIGSLISAIENAENYSEASLNLINDKIGGTYSIDRTSEVEKIRDDPHPFIFVTGEAGSGKSVVCKKLAESYDHKLFVRSERLASSSVLKDVWGLDILEFLRFLGDEKYLFFIDALEFVSDNNEKIRLLSSLFLAAQNHPNVKIVCSCRTWDAPSFYYLINYYKINLHEISPLSKKEILQIQEHFPQLKDANLDSPFFSYPFYLNLVIENTDVASSQTELGLRQAIWKKAVCLEGRSLPVPSQEIESVINKIALERANNFSLGVDPGHYDEKVINALVSNGVLLKDASTGFVRLRYDIFEDLCFENLIDKAFLNCRGNYEEFFTYLNGLSRMGYRRYQIWVSNKLLFRDEKEKFLYEIIFNRGSNTKWPVETMKGVCASKYSSPFFQEYQEEIGKAQMFILMAWVCNRFSFELRNVDLQSARCDLIPVGEGRSWLIRIAYSSHLYLDESSGIFDQIIRLILDYSEQFGRDKETDQTCFEILKTRIEGLLSSKHDFSEDYLMTLLALLYRFSAEDKTWLRDFFLSAQKHYLDNDSYAWFYEKVIENALSSENAELVRFHTDLLFDLAETFYTKEPKVKDAFSYSIYGGSSLKDFGLTRQAEEYDQDIQRGYSRSFFVLAIKDHFWESLTWAISFLNKAALSFFQDKQNQRFILHFWSAGKEKTYFGNGDFWQFLARERSLPFLLSDLIYLLGIKAETILVSLPAKDRPDFLLKIRDLIYEKTNNIAPLWLVAMLGMKYPNIIPGYCSDLLSSFSLIYLDVYRALISRPNENVQLLENEIYALMGMPPMKKRYDPLPLPDMDLRAYLINLSLFKPSLLAESPQEIYHYLVERSIKEGMDKELDLFLKSLNPEGYSFKVLPDGKGILVETKEGEMPQDPPKETPEDVDGSKLNQIINQFLTKEKASTASTEQVKKLVAEILATMTKATLPSHQKYAVFFMAYALTKDDLDLETRNQYCAYFIENFQKKMRGEVFVFDLGYSVAFFQQIDQPIHEDLKKGLKEILYNSCLTSDYQSPSFEIAKYSFLYLRRNKKLARNILNTAIAMSLLAKETSSALDSFPQDRIRFSTPEQGRAYDERIAFRKKRAEEIKQEFLFSNVAIDVQSLDYSKCDLNLLGPSIFVASEALESSEFLSYFKCLYPLIVQGILTGKPDDEKGISFSCGHQISECVQRLVLLEPDNQALIEIIFASIPKGYSRRTSEFYMDCFSSLASEFFDSYNDAPRRSKCKRVINLIENKLGMAGDYRGTFERIVLLNVGSHLSLDSWKNCESSFNYRDKQFLFKLFATYGADHLVDVLTTIHFFHCDLLLPEVISPVTKLLSKCPNDWLTKQDGNEVSRYILHEILLTCYLRYCDKIRADVHLTDSFEAFLRCLERFGVKEAFVIADEFDSHWNS